MGDVVGIQLHMYFVKINFTAKLNSYNQLRISCRKYYCLIGISDPVLNKKFRYLCMRFGVCSLRRD